MHLQTYRKRDKPTRDEMRAEIDVMKKQLADSRPHVTQQQTGARLRQRSELRPPR